MRRATLIRAAGIIALIALYVAALTAINRESLPARPHGQAGDAWSLDDNFSTQLRRCKALGPQDRDDAHCRAVWAENRRRFFGLSPKTLLGASPRPASASPSKPDASPPKPQSSNAGDARE